MLSPERKLRRYGMATAMVGLATLGGTFGIGRECNAEYTLTDEERGITGTRSAIVQKLESFEKAPKISDARLEYARNILSEKSTAVEEGPIKTSIDQSLELVEQTLSNQQADLVPIQERLSETLAMIEKDPIYLRAGEKTNKLNALLPYQMAGLMVGVAGVWLGSVVTLQSYIKRNNSNSR